MKAIKIALFLLVSVYSAEAAEQTPADKLSEIMNRGKLIIATITDYPPQADLVKGVKRNSDTKCLSSEYVSAEFTGFDIDVAKEAAKRLGLEACFVTPAWSVFINGRWGDRWDIAFASVSITSERVKSLYFAQPYSSEPAAFYVHKNNTTFGKPADLSGKKIGICTGCLHEYYLDGTLVLPGQKIEYLVRNPDIIGYYLQAESVRDLSSGKTDAVLVSVSLGGKSISDGMSIRQLGEPVFYSYVAPIIDKKHSKNPISFIKKINEIIVQMHNDGTLSKLSEKYYTLKTDFVTQAKKFDIRALGQY